MQTLNHSQYLDHADLIRSNQLGILLRNMNQYQILIYRCVLAIFLQILFSHLKIYIHWLLAIITKNILY